MKYIKLISLFILVLIFSNTRAQNYSTLAEVISSGGGESTGGNYSNFGVVGETFTDYSVTGGNYITSIGFLYASGIIDGIDEEYFNDPIISIFPNPTTGEFIIEMNITKVTDLEIRLLNVIGQVIYQEKLNKYVGEYQKAIDVGNYAKGIYTLQMITDEGTINRKIVVE